MVPAPAGREHVCHGHVAVAARVSMSPSIPFLLLAAVASVPAHAATTLPAAGASTVLIAGSSVVLDGRAEIITTDFGAHTAVHAGGQARASVRLGADSAGVPFIAYSASASGQSFADLTGQVFYNWAVEGAAADGELVPVTITTMGWFRGQVTAQALQADVQVGASVNFLGMGISNQFQTSVDGGLDFRTHGLTAGNRNMGVTAVVFDDPALSLPGGSVTAQGEASFSETFSLWVHPNLPNSITMAVSGGTGNSALYNDIDSVRYSWQMSGYIDPIIRIDPAYAARFSVARSSMPMLPVPEASTWAMLLAGLGLLLRTRRR